MYTDVTRNFFSNTEPILHIIGPLTPCSL